MDMIFKKSTNVFNAVSISIKEPYRYDKHGQLKPEYLEEALRRESAHHGEGPKFESEDSANESSEIKGTETRVE
jgi:hypothetical protein